MFVGSLVEADVSSGGLLSLLIRYSVLYTSLAYDRNKFMRRTL